MRQGAIAPVADTRSLLHATDPSSSSSWRVRPEVGIRWLPMALPVHLFRKRLMQGWAPAGTAACLFSRPGKGLLPYAPGSASSLQARKARRTAVVLSLTRCCHQKSGHDHHGHVRFSVSFCHCRFCCWLAYALATALMPGSMRRIFPAVHARTRCPNQRERDRPGQSFLARRGSARGRPHLLSTKGGPPPRIIPSESSLRVADPRGCSSWCAARG